MGQLARDSHLFCEHTRYSETLQRSAVALCTVGEAVDPTPTQVSPAVAQASSEATTVPAILSHPAGALVGLPTEVQQRGANSRAGGKFLAMPPVEEPIQRAIALPH